MEESGSERCVGGGRPRRAVAAFSVTFTLGRRTEVQQGSGVHVLIFEPGGGTDSNVNVGPCFGFE